MEHNMLYVVEKYKNCDLALFHEMMNSWIFLCYWNWFFPVQDWTFHFFGWKLFFSPPVKNVGKKNRIQSTGSETRNPPDHMYSTLGFASGEIHVIWDISYFASSRRHLGTTKKKRTFSPCSKLSLPRWRETFTTDSRLTFSETEAEKNRLAQKKTTEFYMSFNYFYFW